MSRRRVLLAAVLVPLALGLAAPLLSRGASTDALRSTVGRQRATEQRLSGAAARLGRIIRGVDRAIAVLERRRADVAANLSAAQGRLLTTQTALRAERRRALRLRARLAQSRRVLAAQLRADYTTDPPSLVTVVLSAHGFADLLEQADFYRRVSHASADVIDAVRRGRADARREARRLAVLKVRRRASVAAITRQRDALTQISAALSSRRATLARARAARLAALRSTRADRRRAEAELARLEAAQARAAVDRAGPGGPWAIPWAIVQCESGGQDLAPNAATASGYYQFLDSTWRGLGGSTKHAFQAPKAEQDRLAARLWAGGAGASNWDCAALVGLS